MGNSATYFFHWSEKDLLMGIQRGDYAAFTEVYHRFVEKLYTFSQKIDLDSADREDVIQEVFSSLWLRRAELNIENLGAWLFMSVRKQALYQLRKKKYQDRYMQSIVEFISPFYDPILGIIQEKELQLYLDTQLTKMPPRAQEIFRLSRNEHLSHKEIAERLDISEKTVRKQIQNVLKVFRYKLGHKTLEGLILVAFLWDKK
ncbi:sigma-70 family RNA polymerase sigma factor [Sphingobacterium faecale]|uniref:Sigma-70 family RNA polymerase sigma factor n=1 Tax=Sphingobacterium faecale TaxID=2803775 RepID=A0ABS1R024_9SPHI|nr:sigma-70 family RNA polymerase sigma factor [Sphingobacterium faecale]MBL1407246.1 sigma-70 family RNA polymerase sigma factor [Sphingobacterium faecale]